MHTCQSRAGHIRFQVNNCANALTLQHVNRCSVQTVRAYAAGRWRTALLRNQPNARTHAAFNPGTALTQKKKTLVPLKNCFKFLSLNLFLFFLFSLTSKDFICCIQMKSSNGPSGKEEKKKKKLVAGKSAGAAQDEYIAKTAGRGDDDNDEGSVSGKEETKKKKPVMDKSIGAAQDEFHAKAAAAGLRQAIDPCFTDGCTAKVRVQGLCFRHGVKTTCIQNGCSTKANALLDRTMVGQESGMTRLDEQATRARWQHLWKR